MDDDAVQAALVQVCSIGCLNRPVSIESAEAEAAFALRRWRSFERRHPKPAKHVTAREARIEDLARGLAVHYEGSIAMAGPLLTDYRWQAGRIADVLDPPP